MTWKHIFLLIAVRLGNIYTFRTQDSFVALQMSTWVYNNSCSSAFGSFQQQSKLKPASDDSWDGASSLSPSRADKKDLSICRRTASGQWCKFINSAFQVQSVQLLIRAMCALSSLLLFLLFLLFLFPKNNPRVKILFYCYIHQSRASSSKIFCFLHTCFSYYYYFDSLAC